MAAQHVPGLVTAGEAVNAALLLILLQRAHSRLTVLRPLSGPDVATDDALMREIGSALQMADAA